jgi:cellulose synthase/poly-beta-1,6-N-acetylglucosamine synthase-like glycosyltransferase
MYLINLINTLALILSFALSFFLMTYVTRSLIFYIIAKSAIRTYFHLEKNVKAISTSSSNFTLLHQYAENDIDTVDLNHSPRKNLKSVIPYLGQCDQINNEPFISILIATYNEEEIVDRLMCSCSNLTYNKDRFEVIVIDDSEDSTFSILQGWQNKIQNLKLVHRENRKGWKGGALNEALNMMNGNSSYALIVDADNVLSSDILERFVLYFNEWNLKDNTVEVIQGFPVSSPKLNKFECTKLGNADLRYNWIANAIDLRLANRNLIEFVAKNKLDLPVQITGTLFMIRSETIKAIGFSEDLTEDWELTLDVYFSSKGLRSHYPGTGNGANIRRRVLYNPLLNADSCSVSQFKTYFRQRMRVSEGHTRGFRKKAARILAGTAQARDKIEFFLMGLQYLKFLAVVTLIVANLILFSSNGMEYALKDNFIRLLLSVQVAALVATIGLSFLALEACGSIRKYRFRDVLNLLFLNFCTMPAFIMGSLYSLFRDEGFFYRTERK